MPRRRLRLREAGRIGPTRDGGCRYADRRGICLPQNGTLPAIVWNGCPRSVEYATRLWNWRNKRSEPLPRQHRGPFLDQVVHLFHQAALCIHIGNQGSADKSWPALARRRKTPDLIASDARARPLRWERIRAPKLRPVRERFASGPQSRSSIADWVFRGIVTAHSGPS